MHKITQSSTLNSI